MSLANSLLLIAGAFMSFAGGFGCRRPNGLLILCGTLLSLCGFLELAP